MATSNLIAKFSYDVLQIIDAAPVRVRVFQTLL